MSFLSVSVVAAEGMGGTADPMAAWLSISMVDLLFARLDKKVKAGICMGPFALAVASPSLLDSFNDVIYE